MIPAIFNLDEITRNRYMRVRAQALNESMSFDPDMLFLKVAGSLIRHDNLTPKSDFDFVLYTTKEALPARLEKQTSKSEKEIMLRNVFEIIQKTIDLSWTTDDLYEQYYTVLATMFDESDVIHCSEIGQLLFRNRDLFLFREGLLHTVEIIRQTGDEILHPGNLYKEVYRWQINRYGFSTSQAKWLLYAIHLAEHIAETGQVRVTFPRYRTGNRNNFQEVYHRSLEALQKYSYEHLPNQDIAALQGLADEIKNGL